MSLIDNFLVILMLVFTGLSLDMAIYGVVKLIRICREDKKNNEKQSH